MPEHSNFTMTPNLAFELLENVHDLVGYQKLIRIVGIGGTWSGGNNALASKLGISYGRVVKLKTKLKAVGFIEVEAGDFGHGEPDIWKLVDIWGRNNSAAEIPAEEVQATLSPNEQPLSQNEQGQETENQPTVENKEDLPCHEKDKRLSPDIQATLSPNEQHNKIFKAEVTQEKNFSFSARTREPEKFKREFLEGLKKRMKLEHLPAEATYIEAAQWLFANKFTAARSLLCYDTLRRQIEHPKHWRKPGRISAKNITETIAELDDLIKQLDDWDNEKEEEKQPKNGQLQRNNSNSPADHRLRKINETRQRIRDLIEEGTAEQNLQSEPDRAACQDPPSGERRAA